MLGLIGPIGTQELIIILVVALIIFGPKRLPELGKSLGKGIKEFKNSTTELTGQVTEEVKDQESVDKTEKSEQVKETVTPTTAETQNPETNAS